MAEITSWMIFNPQKLCAVSPYLQGLTEAIHHYITQTCHNARNAISVCCWSIWLSFYVEHPVFFDLELTIKLYTLLVLKWLELTL